METSYTRPFLLRILCFRGEKKTLVYCQDIGYFMLFPGGGGGYLTSICV